MKLQVLLKNNNNNEPWIIILHLKYTEQILVGRPNESIQILILKTVYRQRLL